MTGEDRAAAAHRRGMTAGIAAYALWGIMPIYFRALDGVDALEIVANRILWSVLLLLVILVFRARIATLIATLRSARLLLPLIASALLIAANWLIYIWAVQNDHVIAASLGYFLNPVINVLLGFVVLGERLSRMQWVAVACAGAGVAVLAAGAMATLWISVSLALSFALYGLIRKMAPTGPMVGLTVETIVLLPAALGVIGWMGAAGTLSLFHSGPAIDGLLMLSGAITAIPLLLFAFAAQRLTLATIGLLQYLAPTIQFLLGLFLFHEPLRPAHLIAFPLIWLGLAIYSAAAWHGTRINRAAS